MEKCYFSAKHKTGRVINYVAALFVSVVCLSLSAYLAITTANSIIHAGLLLCIGLLMLLFGILFDLYMSREYALSEAGITIRYARRKTVFFPWSRISRICICVIHRGKIEGVEDEVIWCTVGEIKKGPPNMARRWNEAEYGFLHFHRVLTMEYTPERLTDFRKYANREIPDYR